MRKRVQRVHGTQDVLPHEYEVNHWIVTRLLDNFRAFGYHPLSVPIVEDIELYLDTGGDSFLGRFYSFKLRNRDICLRPEWTASVIRAYIDGNTHSGPDPTSPDPTRPDPTRPDPTSPDPTSPDPTSPDLRYLQTSPVRLCYAGPVFRQEPLQRIQQRQFTQVGVELIGAAGSLADAELIAMACQSLDGLGLEKYEVRIGHIGILRAFLGSLDSDERMRSVLLASVDKLPEERADVERNLRNLCLGFEEVEEALDPALSGSRLADLFGSLEDQQAHGILMDLLVGLGINLKGNRAPEEVVERLLVKIKRQTHVSELYKALDFIEHLAELVGSVPEILARGQQVLETHPETWPALAHLQQVVELLQAYGVKADRIQLDLGLGRGLQYYTGVVFEIHHPLMPTESLLCGGGRYDHLVAALGGSPTPATGFAFGLERIRHALHQEAATGTTVLPQPTAPTAVITVTDEAAYGQGIQLTQALRAQGIWVVMDVQGRDPEQYAQQSRIPYVVQVGDSPERVILKDLRGAGTAQSMTIVEIATTLRG